jgi:serine/threonine protein kinase
MEISPEKWETVKTLFAAALELPAKQRPDFLRLKCADSTLRLEVDRLLVEHEQAGSTLSHAPFGSAAPPWHRPSRFESGQVLADRFRILRFVAAGGMGEVYEAEDLELRECLALKVIRPEALDRSDAIARFKREVHLARRVTHPNACRIFDLFLHKPSGSDIGDATYFVSMEFLRGETLAERIHRQGRFSLMEALPMIHQMAAALSAAHDAGIVHRDFKPANVVLVKEPAGIRAVVTDFGLAYQTASPSAETALTTSSGQLGTIAYMSPEQLEGHPATTASDIYALGLVIYEMAVGRRPFESDSLISIAAKRLAEPAPSPRDVEASLSPVFESVVLRCLEREPSKRFAQVKDVSSALTADVIVTPVSATEPINQTVPKPIRNRHRPSGWRTLAAMVVTVALLISILAIRFSRSHQKPPQVSGAPSTSDRVLRYSIVVQSYQQGEPYGVAFRVNEGTIFRAGDGFRMMFSSPQPGFLYILNEGPSSTEQEPIFNTLFPRATANGGSAQLLPDHELAVPETGSFIFDTHKGTEKLWLVWSNEALPDLEMLKKWANLEDRGKIGDLTQAQHIQSFLAKSTPSSAESSGDDKDYSTTLSGGGKTLVHLVKLNHE